MKMSMEVQHQILKTQTQRHPKIATATMIIPQTVTMLSVKIIFCKPQPRMRRWCQEPLRLPLLLLLATVQHLQDPLEPLLKDLALHALISLYCRRAHHPGQACCSESSQRALYHLICLSPLLTILQCASDREATLRLSRDHIPILVLRPRAKSARRLPEECRSIGLRALCCSTHRLGALLLGWACLTLSAKRRGSDKRQFMS